MKIFLLRGYDENHLDRMKKMGGEGANENKSQNQGVNYKVLKTSDDLQNTTNSGLFIM